MLDVSDNRILVTTKGMTTLFATVILDHQTIIKIDKTSSYCVDCVSCECHATGSGGSGGGGSGGRVSDACPERQLTRSVTGDD